ncbi:hypothetical protein [Teredinibacter sp. KSP-S5-2]|uniref:hypothetical protein n=1 Tax=Teredinibacter sp. KSP-S5-2 TaxID=3034506 RepID=UPI0029345F7B|nr:hypothetical protein [Teredinibacter sp. KSP-S5-2]WNO11647.1 hypothetical protein P5V12_10735 [Teredinibacter sp. KSP-S5-2]
MRRNKILLVVVAALSVILGSCGGGGSGSSAIDSSTSSSGGNSGNTSSSSSSGGSGSSSNSSSSSSGGTAYNPVSKSSFVTIPGLYHYTRTDTSWLDGSALPYGTYISAADIDGVPASNIVDDLQVKAVLTKPGGIKIPLSFVDIEPGMYFIRVMGRVNQTTVPRIRRPLLLDLKINDGPNGEISHYRMRAAYDNTVKEVARIFFHGLNDTNNLTAELSVAEGSQEDLYIHRIEFFDALAGTYKVAGKTASSTFTPEERTAYREEAAFIASQPPYTWSDDGKIYYPDTNEWRWVNHQYHGKTNTAAERLARDERVWNSQPPINAMHTGGSGGLGGSYDTTYQMAPSGQTVIDDRVTNGEWKIDIGTLPAGSSNYAFDVPWKLINEKLGLEYTLEDYKQHKPLPSPYPWGDAGTGLYFAEDNAAGTGSPGSYYNIIGPHIFKRIYYQGFQTIWNHDGGGLNLAKRYHAVGAPDDEAGNDDAARDAAILLVRLALNYPSYHLEAQDLAQVSAIPHLQIASDYRWEGRRVGQYQYHGWAATRMEQLTYAYDYLFDYIQGNEDLAQRLHDFVPWIKTSQDVIKLLDTNILQYAVACIGTNRITSTAPYIYGMVQMPTSFSGDWMNAFTSSMTVYPARMQTIDYHYHNSYTQDGTSFIGSTSYTQGDTSDLFELYKSFKSFIRNGGTVVHDLSDPVKYPKIKSAAKFLLDTSLAGGYEIAVGDVGGAPYKSRRLTSSTLLKYLPEVWEITQDPRAAWLLVNEPDYGGRRGLSDSEWSKVQTAAATQLRDPRQSTESRVLPGFGLGILEEGVGQNDYRKKTAVQLRTGNGVGHAHADALDLNFFALGLRMGTDIAQRDEGENFTLPPSTRSIVHNVVEVDGLLHPWKNKEDPNNPEAIWPTGNFDSSDAWIDVFKPVSGGQIMGGEGKTGSRYKNYGLFRRDLALIDLDGESAYVMDCFRVSGGKLHTWSFHGGITNNETDGLSVNGTWTNSGLADTGSEIGSSAMYMRKYANGSKFEGTAPTNGPIEATWRLGRTASTSNECNGDNTCVDVTTIAAEQAMHGSDYNATSARKYTKITLFEHEGERLLKGNLISGKYQMNFPRLHVQNTQNAPYDKPYAELPDLESVYPMVLEAYAGTSKLGTKASVAIDNNDTDARKAVLLETAVSNGTNRTDWFFSDLYDKARTITSRNATIHADRVVFSKDDSGLRFINLVGGKQFKAGDIVVQPDSDMYQATVTAVDYVTKKVTLNTPFPAKLLQGENLHFYNEGHHSSYKLIDTAANTITVENSPVVGKINISAIAGDGMLTRDSTYLLADYGNRNRGFTAATEDHAKSTVMLHYDQIPAGSISMADLTDVDGDGYTSLLIYDFGPTDTAEILTHVGIKRTGTGTYDIDANVGFTLTLPLTNITSANFKAPGAQAVNLPISPGTGTITISITAAQLNNGQGVLELL